MCLGTFIPKAAHQRKLKTPDFDELLAARSSHKPESYRDIRLALRNGNFKVSRQCFAAD